MSDYDDAMALGTRAAAALAELGHAPYRIRVRPHTIEPDQLVAALCWPYGTAPPVEVRWKAWVVAGSTETPCRECHRWSRPDGLWLTRRAPCLERGLGTLDCGVERP